jgi:hypothetical protein
MPRYDDKFVDRFLEPWNRHDVDGALSLMTGDCVWEIARGRPHDTQFIGRRTHPVDDAVGFRTVHRQWLVTFSHEQSSTVPGPSHYRTWSHLQGSFLGLYDGGRWAPYKARLSWARVLTACSGVLPAWAMMSRALCSIRSITASECARSSHMADGEGALATTSFGFL